MNTAGCRGGSGLPQRVGPAQAWETRKIGVVRMDLGLMLDGEGSEVDIRRETSRDSGGTHQAFQKLQMARAWLENLDLGPLKPGANVSDRFVRRQGVLRPTSSGSLRSPTHH